MGGGGANPSGLTVNIHFLRLPLYAKQRMVDQAVVDFDQEVALHRSETSPVGLRINYLWLMLVPMRTLPLSTNGRHSGCVGRHYSALGERLNQNTS